MNFDVASVNFIGQISLCLLKIKLFVNAHDFRVSQRCKMRTALIWDFTKRRMVFCYRRFGTTYRSQIQGANGFLGLLQIF